ncbi:MAG: sulfite exporter TauE/SafE family protein [Hyphomicrobiaceae bacterium]
MDAILASPWGLLAAAGLLIGFLVGLTGVGAGAITTPMLISGFGLHPAVAVGTDLLFAAITKSTAALRHHRMGNVDWPVLLWLAGGSLTAAAITLTFLHWTVPDTERLATIIRGGLTIVLIASAIIIPLCPVLLRNRRDDDEVPVTNTVRRAATVAAGVVLGVLVSLTSVGAGAIGVAALSALYPMLRARRIVGTDVVHAIPLTLFSGAGHLGLGNVDWATLAALLCGSIPGIAIGSRLTGHLPEWVMRLGLSAVLLFAAYLMVPSLMRMLGTN